MPDDIVITSGEVNIAVAARGGDHLNDVGVHAGNLAGTPEGCNVGVVLFEG